MSSEVESVDVDKVNERFMRELAMVRQRMTAIEEENEELNERVEHLHDVIAQLVTDLPTSKKSKREKMAAIVDHAVKNGSTTPKGVNITKDAAAGAASCTPRHALNLFTEMDEQFEWAVKITTPRAKLGIDFDEREADEFLRDLSREFPEVTVE